MQLTTFYLFFITLFFVLVCGWHTIGRQKGVLISCNKACGLFTSGVPCMEFLSSVRLQGRIKGAKTTSEALSTIMLQYSRGHEIILVCWWTEPQAKAPKNAVERFCRNIIKGGEIFRL